MSLKILHGFGSKAEFVRKRGRDYAYCHIQYWMWKTCLYHIKSQYIFSSVAEIVTLFRIK